MSVNKRKHSFFKYFCLWSAVFGTAFAVGVWNMPNSVRLLEGTIETLHFGSLMKAEIAQDSVHVASVANEEVKDNLHLDLSGDVDIETKQAGNAKISVSLLGVIPIKTVNVEILPQKELVPCGMAVGVTMKTDGIMVLGTGSVSEADNKNLAEPAKGKLKSGDLIHFVDGVKMEKKEDLIEVIESWDGAPIPFDIMRSGKQMEVLVTPVISQDDGKPKVGIWVRCSTQGIGTVTYYNPQTNGFGALGHGVYDVDTKQLMSLKDGKINLSEITGITKGTKGEPGEILGGIDKSEKLGDITSNTDCGLYGKIDQSNLSFFPPQRYPIALKQDIKVGEAFILSDAAGNGVEKYSVQIESVNIGSDDSKGMVIKITDDRLLRLTGGIVQGMSGSPILQDGKLIGAVTHVFVQEPAKGYGIFIENMLKEEQKAVA